MIPRSATAWTGLVHDRYLYETVGFLQDDPYGLRLEKLVEMTVNEISYSGTFRHLSAGDIRSEPARLWTTDANLISLEQAQAPHVGRDTAACPRPRNGERTRALVQRRARARRLALDRPRRPTDALGDDDGAAALARGAQGRTWSSGPESGPRRPARSGPGRAGRSRCRAPSGRSTTSSRSGWSSTTERLADALCPHARSPSQRNRGGGAASAAPPTARLLGRLARPEGSDRILERREDALLADHVGQPESLQLGPDGVRARRRSRR